MPKTPHLSRYSRAISGLTLTLFLSVATAPAQQSPAKKPPKTPVAPPPAAVAPKGGEYAGIMEVRPPRGLLLFNRALQATKAGDAAEAERLYRALLKDYPKEAAAWANLGLLVARDGRLAEGIGHLEKATRLEPKRAAYWAQLSSVQSKIPERAAAAAASAKKALALEPKNQDALRNLSAALLRQRKHAEAVPVLRRLRAVVGEKDKQLTLSLIYALASAGKNSEARDLARKTAARSPKDARPYLLLGDLAAQAGDYKEAATAYQRAAVLAPSDARAAMNAAIALEMQGNRDAAIAAFQKLTVRFPQDARMHFHLGRLYYGNESLPPAIRFPQAEAAFRTAVSRDPKNAMFLNQLGLSLMFQDKARHGEAGSVFDAALFVDPKNTTARMGKAFLAEQEGHADEALDMYRAILADFPNDYEARRRMAGVLYLTDKKDAAYQEFEELARRHPNNLTPLGEMASLLVNDKRFDEAKKVYARILARDPKNLSAHLATGQILENEEKTAQAKAQYETAIKAIPNRSAAPLYFALADIWQREKKTEQVVAVFRRLLALDPQNLLARWHLAQAYQTLGKPADALREARLTAAGALKQKRDPNYLLYRLGPANLLGTQNKHAEAVAELQKLRREEPKDERIAFALVDALDKAGNSEASEKLLNELSQKAAPNDPRPHLSLAHLAERRERWDDAAAAFETALRRAPASNEALFGLRRVREKQGKPDAAMAFLEEMALSDPAQPNREAVASVATLYGADKAPQKYLTFAQRLAEKYPKDRYSLSLYAQAALGQSKTPAPAERETAMGVYRRMLDNDARDADAWFRLGAQLEALGKKDEAIPAYQSAVKFAASPSDPSAMQATEALRRLGAPTIAAAASGSSTAGAAAAEANKDKPASTPNSPPSGNHGNGD